MRLYSSWPAYQLVDTIVDVAVQREELLSLALSQLWAPEVLRFQLTHGAAEKESSEDPEEELEEEDRTVELEGQS